MTDADKTRIEIEKEAQVAVDVEYDIDYPYEKYYVKGYARGATVWAERLNKQRKEDQAVCEKWKQSAETLSERLKQERNKAIDEYREKLRVQFREVKNDDELLAVISKI